MAGNDAVIEAIYQLLSCGAPLGAGARGAGALGIRVSRAAAADPQNVWQNLFTIAGGVIALTSLIGVRTVIQAGGASNMQWRHSVGPTVLDAVLAIAGDPVGTIYVLTGDTTDPIVAGGANLAAVMAGKVVATSTTYGGKPLFYLGDGTIDVTMTAGAGTGSTRYIMTYIPMDDTVTVV